MRESWWGYVEELMYADVLEHYYFNDWESDWEHFWCYKRPLSVEKAKERMDRICLAKQDFIYQAFSEARSWMWV